MKSIQVEADVKNLAQVQEFIADELMKYDVSPKTQFQIDVAVEEIFINIASYSYENGVGQATINCSVNQNPLSVVIQFLDNGVPFDPLAKEDADLSEEAILERVGGLGIYMVKNTMDGVSYSYEDGKNILTIEKHLE